MIEVLGFFLVLAALGLLVGTLAQGPLRIAGFVVLVLMGLMASGPILERTPLGSFFNSGASQTDEETAPYNLPSSPVPASPAYGGQPQSDTGANSSTSRRSTRSSNNRGIRGGW